MTLLSLVDPELREFFESLPAFDLNGTTLKSIRKMTASRRQLVDELPAAVVREEIFIPGYEGSPKVRCLIYRPADGINLTPAYLHLHGGGMVLGSADESDMRCIEICERLGAVVLSVDYRLAPEHPYPAALHDAYAGLAYLHTASETLNVDRARIAIGGVSAGGGLAASLSLFARDHAEYSICHQHLVFPMIDDQTGRDGKPHDSEIGMIGWTREHNVYGWDSYLGGTCPTHAYIPARTASLSQLPPTWIGVGDLDLFFPENIEFARRLTQQGVPVAFDIYPKAPHGFPMMQNAKVSRKFEDDFVSALARGLRVNA